MASILSVARAAQNEVRINAKPARLARFRAIGTGIWPVGRAFESLSDKMSSEMSRTPCLIHIETSGEKLVANLRSERLCATSKRIFIACSMHGQCTGSAGGKLTHLLSHHGEHREECNERSWLLS